MNLLFNRKHLDKGLCLAGLRLQGEAEVIWWFRNWARWAFLQRGASAGRAWCTTAMSLWHCGGRLRVSVAWRWKHQASAISWSPVCRLSRKCVPQRLQLSRLVMVFVHIIQYTSVRDLFVKTLDAWVSGSIDVVTYSLNIFYGCGIELSFFDFGTSTRNCAESLGEVAEMFSDSELNFPIS